MRIVTIGGIVVVAAVSTYLGIETRRNRLVWDHFDVVKPGILYRSGQLNPDQLTRAVAQNGIRTVVNFQRPGPDVTRERLLAKRLGVDFLNLPMTGDGFGLESQFREVLKACEDPERRPVLIHCARGTCRTGAATALYRYEHDGWTIDDVSEEMRRQSYKDGWLPGYVFEMVKDRPGFPLLDPPIAFDVNRPPSAPPAAAAAAAGPNPSAGKPDDHDHPHPHATGSAHDLEPMPMPEIGREADRRDRPEGPASKADRSVRPASWFPLDTDDDN